MWRFLEVIFDICFLTLLTKHLEVIIHTSFSYISVLSSEARDHRIKCQTVGFTYPKRKFGKRERSFNPTWYKIFPWLHYCVETDFVLCHICMTQHKQGNIKLATKLEMTFIETGFTNWKKAMEKFKDHENSSCHRQAMHVSEIPERNANLPEIFDSKLT